MKDTLKDFVSQNRDGFDAKTPSENSWREIESTLPAVKGQLLWSSVIVWRVAALVFFGLSVYFFTTRTQPTVGVRELTSLQREFTDLELFYNTEIVDKVALINSFDNANEHEKFTQDFQKLDAMYQVLKEQMKIQPTKKVRDALVLNLLVRIDLLNQQLHRLEKEFKKDEKKDISV